MDELNIVQKVFKTKDGQKISITVQVESSQENTSQDDKTSIEPCANEIDGKDKDCNNQNVGYVKELTQKANTPKDHKPDCPFRLKNLNVAAPTTDVMKRNLRTEEKISKAVAPCKETSDGRIESVSNEIINDAKSVTKDVDDEDLEEEEEEEEEDPKPISIIQRIKNFF